MRGGQPSTAVLIFSLRKEGRLGARAADYAGGGGGGGDQKTKKIADTVAMWAYYYSTLRQFLGLS
jgi:hypothetical protein